MSVYFITDSANRFVKIGYSSDPYFRLRNIRDPNGKRPVLQAFVDGTRKTEKNFHKQFAEYHIANEWFTLAGDLKNFVKSLPPPPAPIRSGEVMKLGELLALSRELKKMTLRDLEAKSGVSNALISQIESGRVKDPGFRTICKLARILGLSLKRLGETE